MSYGWRGSRALRGADPRRVLSSSLLVGHPTHCRDGRGALHTRIQCRYQYRLPECPFHPCPWHAPAERGENTTYHETHSVRVHTCGIPRRSLLVRIPVVCGQQSSFDTVQLLIIGESARDEHKMPWSGSNDLTSAGKNVLAFLNLNTTTFLPQRISH